MQTQRKTRRPAGSGWLDTRRDSAGRETWYGKFYVGEKQVKRALGRKREPGESVGLTRKQAEAKLRGLMSDASAVRPVAERVDVEEAGARYLRHLETLGRKPTTLMDYESTLRVHLAPFFAGRAITSIRDTEIQAFVAAKLMEGKAPKSVLNYVGLSMGSSRSR